MAPVELKLRGPKPVDMSKHAPLAAPQSRYLIQISFFYFLVNFSKFSKNIKGFLKFLDVFGPFRTCPDLFRYLQSITAAGFQKNERFCDSGIDFGMVFKPCFFFRTSIRYLVKGFPIFGIEV